MRRTLLPPYVVLVHGEANEMMRLKGALQREFQEKGIQVLTPKNAESAAMTFRSEKVAKVCFDCLNLNMNCAIWCRI